MNSRNLAMSWWNILSLEDKLYFMAESNTFINEDNLRHPNTLTGSEVESLWKTVTQSL